MAKAVEKVHIGIDISKDKLDIFIHESGKYLQINNNLRSIKEFFGKYHGRISLVVFEHTGVYSWNCVDGLRQLGIDYHAAHPLRVKSYIRGLGLLAKTDKIDAKALARYATENYVKKSRKSGKYQRKLHVLAVRRCRLRKNIEAEKNCLRQFGGVIGTKSFEKVIKPMEKEMLALEKNILEIIRSDHDLNKVFEAILSIKSIGKVTASLLLALIPELGSMNRNQVASLVGVAPINRDSGTKSGRRFIRGGRALARRTLYMSALVGAHKNSTLKEFYQRLLGKGKLKKQALTAVMRKLLNHINATAKTALQN